MFALDFIEKSAIKYFRSFSRLFRKIVESFGELIIMSNQVKKTQMPEIVNFLTQKGFSDSTKEKWCPKV